MYIEIYVIHMYVYPTLFCVSGEAGMDGCLWMALHDVSTVAIISSYPINHSYKEKNSSHYLSSSIHLDVILDNSCVGRYYYCLHHFTHTLSSKSRLFLLEHVSRYIQTEMEKKTEFDVWVRLLLCPHHSCHFQPFLVIEVVASSFSNGQYVWLFGSSNGYSCGSISLHVAHHIKGRLDPPS